MNPHRRRLLLVVAVAIFTTGVALAIIGLAGMVPSSSEPDGSQTAVGAHISIREPWIRDLWAALRAEAQDEVGSTYDLLVSDSPDRSNPVPLDGLITLGDIYVFISPDTGITQVRFFLDDTLTSTAQQGPYDLLGGSPSAANPLDPTSLGGGQHTIGAEIDLSAGETVTMISTFTVALPGGEEGPPIPPTRLDIEAIGVTAPIIPLGVDPELAPEVPSNGADVGWYDFSGKPGAGSNVVLAGHVTWDKKPAVFSQLRELGVGDLIYLTTDREDKLAYEVTANLLVDPSDPESVQLIYPTDTEMLTLVTCGGTFNRDAGARFGGQYTHRSIVQAKPVS